MSDAKCPQQSDEMSVEKQTKAKSPQQSEAERVEVVSEKRTFRSSVKTIGITEPFFIAQLDCPYCSEIL